MEQVTATGHFDRDFSLTELLGHERGAALLLPLQTLLGTPLCLRDAGGDPLLGDPDTGGERVALTVTLEPVGFLEAAAPRTMVVAAAALATQLLKSELRYRMASSLHTEAIHSDYSALKEKHAALEASEARYRELSGNLERRVHEQMDALEQTQRQLYQAAKLASVGQLAAGVAHEINTPIGFIRSNLNTANGYRDVLERFYHDTTPEGLPAMDGLFADFRELLHESLDGTERVARIVAALKAFSRVDLQQVEATDLNQVIRNALEVVRPQAVPEVQFVAVLQPLPLFTCNAGNLGEAILNLLTNAVEAVGHGGRIEVRSGMDAGEIVISISDNGRGISETAMPRIFEPFFTTKEVGQGTGLGLTVAHDIIRAHGGTILVESRAGSGTRVLVRLPPPSGGTP